TATGTFDRALRGRFAQHSDRVATRCHRCVDVRVDLVAGQHATLAAGGVAAARASTRTLDRTLRGCLAQYGDRVTAHRHWSVDVRVDLVAGQHTTLAA